MYAREFARSLKGRVLAVFTGNATNETFTGGADNDTIYGAGGDDLLTGNGGDDSIYGGTGSDTASYAGAPVGIVVTDMVSVIGNASSGNDVLSGIDVLEARASPTRYRAAPWPTRCTAAAETTDSRDGAATTGYSAAWATTC